MQDIKQVAVSYVTKQEPNTGGFLQITDTKTHFMSNAQYEALCVLYKDDPGVYVRDLGMPTIMAFQLQENIEANRKFHDNGQPIVPVSVIP